MIQPAGAAEEGGAEVTSGSRAGEQNHFVCSLRKVVSLGHCDWCQPWPEAPVRLRLTSCSPLTVLLVTSPGQKVAAFPEEKRNCVQFDFSVIYVALQFTKKKNVSQFEHLNNT